MALFGNDYDREYGNRGTWDRNDRGTTRGGAWGGGARNDPGMRGGGMWGGGPGYDREFHGGSMNRDRAYREQTYGRGYSAENRDYGWGAGGAYDGDMVGRGYDREYKTRQQTDVGDPFNDRQSGTPMRMIHGEYERGYDRGYRGGAADYDRGYRGVDRTRYDRNYMGRETGVNNDPYYGGMNRPQRDRGYRGPGNDRDWF